MENKTMRFTLSIPVDLAKRATILKKNIFYDKPYAEMYRQLILLGMKTLQEMKDENINPAGANMHLL